MAPRAADPTRYKLHVVSFSIVREPEPSPTSTASRSRTRLNDPASVAYLARQLVADGAREHFWALLLDSQNGLVAAQEVSTGTLSASLVHPREVFGPAFRFMGVASLVLVHNHPSGDATPSHEDLRVTRQLSVPSSRPWAWSYGRGGTDLHENFRHQRCRQTPYPQGPR